jgi:hypothetical protein
MADGVLEWAKRQREDWIKSVEMMQVGSLRMREDGRDVTEEWTAYLLGKIAEIDAIVIKHEARNA